MMVAAMLLVAAQAATPDAEAIALGERLAATGTLAALLPLVEAKETDEVVAAQEGLNAAEQAQLRSVAARTYAGVRGRLFAVQGRRYAELLTVAELRELVAAAESPSARRLGQVMPQAIAAAAGAMDGVDVKRDALAAFCRETGKGCAAK
jgi:hypothetical protein